MVAILCQIPGLQRGDGERTQPTELRQSMGTTCLLQSILQVDPQRNTEIQMGELLRNGNQN